MYILHTLDEMMTLTTQGKGNGKGKGKVFKLLTFARIIQFIVY